MFLPQLHDELARAARAPRPARRLGGLTMSALTAAFVTLLLAAPAAQAQLTELAALPVRGLL
jgi:hypothetical protein